MASGWRCVFPPPPPAKMPSGVASLIAQPVSATEHAREHMQIHAVPFFLGGGGGRGEAKRVPLFGAPEKAHPDWCLLLRGPFLGWCERTPEEQPRFWDFAYFETRKLRGKPQLGSVVFLESRVDTKRKLHHVRIGN